MLLVAVVVAASPVELPALQAELAKGNPDVRAHLERGLRQVQKLWKPSDGDLTMFAKVYFLANDQARDATLDRFEYNLEQLDGYALSSIRELKKPMDLDVGPLLPIDRVFAGFDPSAHQLEDLFANKLGFVALLNFPLTTLDERTANGMNWTRRQWAEVRLADRFARRVPGEVRLRIATAQADSELYINGYNLWMHHVLSADGKRLFPKGKRLLSHWNLRDELKADYALPDGLALQRVIVKLMERIVTQTIPQQVIDNPMVDWNPFSNEVTAAPADTVEEGGGRRNALPSNKAEPDTRYQKWMNNFTALKGIDPFSPTAPTAIARAFDVDAEIPEARVKAMFTDVLTSPLVAKTAAVIAGRLKRPLEAGDIWYDGFLPRSSIPESELDAKVSAKYPNATAYAADIPRILVALGFTEARAAEIASHIKVDPARGSGHALQAQRRGDDAHLRTRFEATGMNYKAYNISIHELGHNVEQTVSLYDVDHTLLAGVPNTAFTEAIAMVFQEHDLTLLGLPPPNSEQVKLQTLSDFWQTYEIAGVGLLDIAAWHWLYDHPNATAAQFRAAVVATAKGLWNTYYAPVLGSRDSPILAIYSHLISYPLYVFNYPVGHLIAFQMKEQVAKAGAAVGPELERMAKLGRLTPDVWMQQATGAPVSAQPLLRATAKALEKQ